MSKTTEKDMERLAFRLYRFLKNKGLDGDVRIYYKGGNCISSHERTGKPEFEKRIHTYRGKEYEYYYCTEEIHASDYFEYANEETLSVSTEGGLYEALNYYAGINYCDSIQGKLNRMFRDYGLYYEQGNCWNFSLYEI